MRKNAARRHAARQMGQGFATNEGEHLRSTTASSEISVPATKETTQKPRTEEKKEDRKTRRKGEKEHQKKQFRRTVGENYSRHNKKQTTKTHR